MTKLRILSIYILIIISWHFIPKYLGHGLTVDAKGQVGDAYGSVNALFSGLALASLIITISIQFKQLLIQQKGLKLQIQELKETRFELKRTAKAQEDYFNAVISSNYINSYNFINEKAQSETAIKYRNILFKSIRYKNLETWTEDDKKIVEEVCRTYSSIGTLYKNNAINYNMIKPWARSICLSWDVSKEHIELLRKQQNFIDLWSDFEYLAGELRAYAHEKRDNPEN